jgi:ABC transporter substrate binding protein
MTEVRDQRSAVRNLRTEINRRDAKCAELFLCGLCASVVKSIPDLRVLISVLCALLFALCFPAEAQQPKKVPRIGYLAGAGSAPSQAFLQGLRDLGYVEGQNIAFEYRTAGFNAERYPDLAAELVRLKVDIIVADTTGTALAAKKATTTIPIVMTTSSDPVGDGLNSQHGATGWERHGIDKYCRRVGWKTSGASEGDRSNSLPRGDRATGWSSG